MHDAWANLITTRNDMFVRKKYFFGNPIKLYEKMMFGFSIVIILILVIIAPILIFSTLNPILKKNFVLNGEIELKLIGNKVNATE